MLPLLLSQPSPAPWAVIQNREEKTERTGLAEPVPRFAEQFDHRLITG